MNREEKEKWMRRALVLAKRAEGRTSPNPMVGAVLVKNGQRVAEGYHKKAGTPHAEVVALKKAGNKARGADLFITLEPCCHQGRTPPCTDAIISSGIRKVYVGTRDPNPMVQGKGIRRLKAAGINVETGILKRECDRLVEYFKKYVQTGRPFVILKSAVSLDGKIATAGGESKWITGPEARKHTHQLRSRVDAILVGAQTVIADNPRLTGRPNSRDEWYPLRVLMDPNLRIPTKARVFENAGPERVAVITRPESGQRKKKNLRNRGIFVIEIPERRGSIPFKNVLEEMGKLNVVSLLVEGGGNTNARIMAEGMVDRVVWYMAPILIGGTKAPGAIGGEGVRKLKKAWRLKNLKVEPVGIDFVIEGDL